MTLRLGPIYFYVEATDYGGIAELHPEASAGLGIGPGLLTASLSVRSPFPNKKR